MALETLSTNTAFGGTQGVYRHKSEETGTDMTFAVYLPPQAGNGHKLPVLWYLSGLTCTHANVMEKGEYRRACAEHGIIFVAPDTSPRGENVADDDAYDMGQGAGFYLDATQEPWAEHFRMESYIMKELPAVIAENFAADMTRQSITGHSMGGHGALTLALKNPGTFKSVSAFAPIASPLSCQWGQKALGGYLGGDQSRWRRYDAVALIEDGAHMREILVDQGDADGFLKDQLKPDLLELACEKAEISLTYRLQPGYDHSYYFISTFMAEHVDWHARKLGA
ncbi:S-formylglutathione hydrolase [Aquisalinus flavus]|uniref:S-formylglutathione hydrolase n=1 Tax=Aquisalinus flavus TaxID=1526572 RepID=A0A8J2Y6B2_9PROT|nr:S-formylglutathione hydrolase [Aquisalinus flavus]MBD0427397.1 S-formylglutathione hydrolase [Aquisalinus flavus]UNE47200.1 S-formylglutathione hydrolase [Aquisalinus flavus]GGD00658.1 S-formylglutathione hydrolase [Aquisalinus flavus]